MQYIHMLRKLFSGNFLNKGNCAIFFFTLHLWIKKVASKIIRSNVLSDLKLLLCPKRTILSFNLTDEAFAYASFTVVCNWFQNRFTLSHLENMCSIVSGPSSSSSSSSSFFDKRASYIIFNTDLCQYNIYRYYPVCKSDLERFQFYFPIFGTFFFRSL